jgi:hypothetical protein
LVVEAVVQEVWLRLLQPQQQEVQVVVVLEQIQEPDNQEPLEQVGKEILVVQAQLMSAVAVAVRVLLVAMEQQVLQAVMAV